jgi:3-hydroxybutyryl-CoA dehydrogenase
MIVTRTVARLVNEAVDALYRGDAEEEDIDTAMKLGVNYPKGPLEWGADLGFAHILQVLDNLEHTYLDGRYRASPLLRRLAHADQLMDIPLVHTIGGEFITDLETAFDRIQDQHTTQSQRDIQDQHNDDDPDKDPA